MVKMSLFEKNREELWELAKKYKLNVTKNIDTEDLRSKVEFAAIEQYEKRSEEIREKLRNEAAIRQRIAEIKVSADLAKVQIDVPANPTITDVVRLEKELGIKKKIPKPSPETIAIEASKKVYALFRNLEQEDVDVVAIPGGKYKFHLWPDKVHVLPEWLINHYRSKDNLSGTRPHTQYREVQGHEKIAARMTATERRQRFAFEVLGDAPKNAKFGIVTDEAVLSKLEQHV
jgi:hypothetical protein